MKRKVQLWRFYDSHDDPAPPVPGQALHRFLRMKDLATTDLTFTDAEQYETQLEPVSSSNPHFILHRIRGDNLPSQRNGWRITELDKRVQELAEGSHLMMLPRNLVAFLGSGFSPRPARFAEWLRRRVGWDVWLEPVIRPDVSAVLQNISKISRVEVKIAADEARKLDLAGFFKGKDEPLAALQAAQRVQEGGIISLSLSVGHGNQADQGWFRELVARLRGADTTHFRQARALVHRAGIEGGTTMVDFIHDKVATEFETEGGGRQRLLDPSVAGQLMGDAWEQFKGVDKVLDFVDLDGRPEQPMPAELLDVEE